MKKKVILKRLFHRNKWRYAIFFSYDLGLIEAAKSIDELKYSDTNKCWYSDQNEDNLHRILKTFRKVADIDISQIISANGTEKSLTWSLEEQNEKSDEDTPTESESENTFFSEKPYRCTITTKSTNVESGTKHGPVRFTINEADGKLVIKFLGNYDKEWIEELKSYGRLDFDKSRNEWLLAWSKLKVDSLSDYFSSRGVAVVLVKSEVTQGLKDARNDLGKRVRSNILSESSLDAIELVRQYLEEKRYSVRTTESYLAHLELFFKYFHKKDPGQITRADLSNFVEEFIIKLGYSASYQNLIISSIKMYYALTGKKRLTLNSIERPRRSRALPKVFSKEEVMNIFGATRNNKHKLMLWLIYSCGLRRSEVTKIRIADLDFKRGILHIRQGKGNVDRQVPIPQKVWEKINTYISSYQPGEYLFEGQTGGRYSVESVYSVFKQSLRRAGIKKDVGVHSLRHSYATHLHESGLDIRYIQELLGHKSTRTTEIYTHVSRRNLFAIRSPIEDMDIG